MLLKTGKMFVGALSGVFLLSTSGYGFCYMYNGKRYCQTHRDIEKPNLHELVSEQQNPLVHEWFCTAEGAVGPIYAPRYQTYVGHSEDIEEAKDLALKLCREAKANSCELVGECWFN